MLQSMESQRVRHNWVTEQQQHSWFTMLISAIQHSDLVLYTYIYQRKQWQPTPVLVPGKSHGRRSLGAAVHGVAKSRTRLSDFTLTFHFHALEKEMATHSSVLAWRIPGMGEPGGLPSILYMYIYVKGILKVSHRNNNELKKKKKSVS